MGNDLEELLTLLDRSSLRRLHREEVRELGRSTVELLLTGYCRAELGIRPLNYLTAGVRRPADHRRARGSR